MTLPALIEEIHGDGIVELRLHANEHNSLDRDLLQRLSESLEAHARVERLRAVAFSSGAEGFFSTGLDPSLFLGASESEVRSVMELVFSLSRRLFFFPVPVVALLNGHCMGASAILAIFCDYRFFVDSHARIGFPEAKIGMNFPAFSARILSDLIGAARARDLLYTGRALKPAEAQTAGLVDSLHSAAELRDAAFRHLRKIASAPPESLRGIKEALRGSYRELYSQCLESDLQSTVATILSPRTQEGFRALHENRRPRFE